MSTLPIGLDYYYHMDSLGGVVNSANVGVCDLGQSGTPLVVTGQHGDALRYTSESHSSWRDVGPQWLDPAKSGTIHWSVSAWVKVDSFPSTPQDKQVVIVEGENFPDNQHRFELGIESSTQRAYFLSTQSNNSVAKVFEPTVLSADTWYLLVGTIDATASQLSLSLNGGAPVTTAHDGTIESDPTETGRLARLNTFQNGGIEGTIDELAIWSNRALSTLEFAELWNGGAGIADILALPETPLWFDENWTHQTALTIPASQVPSTQTDFTVFVSIVNATLGAQAQANGDDILFTDDTGATKLAHEIESYDSATGTLVAWVKVPQLSGVSDTGLYLYYGNAGASNQEDVANTWDSNFLMVWHANQDPSGPAPQITDSSGNGNHGTTHGTMTAGDVVAAQVGNGLDVDGIDDYIEVAAFAGTFPTEAATLSLWVDLVSNTPISSQAALGRIGGSGLPSAYPWTDNTLFLGAFRVARVQTGDNSLFDKSVSHLLTITTEPGVNNYIIYQNAVVFETHDAEATVSMVNPLRLGAGPAGNFFCQGILDEVRISNVVRSPDWITTEYNNQSSPGSFVIVGATVSRVSGASLALMRRRRRAA